MPLGSGMCFHSRRYQSVGLFGLHLPKKGMPVALSKRGGMSARVGGLKPQMSLAVLHHGVSVQAGFAKREAFLLKKDTLPP